MSVIGLLGAPLRAAGAGARLAVNMTATAGGTALSGAGVATGGVRSIAGAASESVEQIPLA